MKKNDELDSAVHKAVHTAFSRAYTSMARKRSQRPKPADVRDVASDSMEVETVPEEPLDQTLDD